MSKLYMNCTLAYSSLVKCYAFDHPTAQQHNRATYPHPLVVRVYKQELKLHQCQPHSLVCNSINSVTTKYIWTLFAPNGW